MPALERGLSLRSGPIMGGILLFAAPSFVLAALTPYAVKLKASDERLIGTVTGNLFTWSTVGSIAGTFATGFVFIPAFGLNSIFLATAGALALVGGVGLWLGRGGASGRDHRAMRTAALIFAACLAAGAAWAGRPPGISAETVYFHENMYHTLRIQKWRDDGRQVLELFLDSQPEAAMVMGDDRALHFRYSRFLALGRAALPEMRSAFFLGGGGFTMPKALHLEKPEVDITVAELDPDVVKAGHEFFQLDRYPGIRVLTGDGRRVLRESGHPWNFIVGDAYRGLRNIPPHLVTKEFFEEVRGKLAPGGAFLMNLIAHRAGPGGVLYASVYRTLASVFPDVWVFSTDPALPEAAQNVLFFAFRDREEGRFRALMGRLEADPRLRFIAGSRVAPPLPGVYGPILTDDYNPVEYLVLQGF
jgi:spermidine synthase